MAIRYDNMVYTHICYLINKVIHLNKLSLFYLYILTMMDNINNRRIQ